MPTPRTTTVTTRENWLSTLRRIARPRPAEQAVVAALPATRGTSVVVLPAPRRTLD
ncbi:hypothetical protein GTQ99_14300 [Kineococcus sp. T13]|uniref:hypothetical protein n=1 Tax=Kineococcus vitellinus TaxID=2696565 RepID=UPI001412D50B|nr:hypothetical protein [Kineococcus vitellinus]NAZ76579.1 hypothetical protein [Kineococcus vitellinus]